MMIETQDAFSSELVKVQQEVQNKFGRYANVYRWDEINSNEFENFASTKVMLILVMFLIVLVASINITAAITMLIMERKKEIGILKSVGATSKMITFSFLLTGISCSLGGIIIGVPLGVFISINANLILHGIEWILSFFTNIFNGNKIVLMDPAYYLSEIQIELPISQIFLIILVTILLSSLVSIIPSIKAGKEKPLDIFRNS